MSEIQINDKLLSCHRDRGLVWGMDLTTVVYISEKLGSGQIRGLEQGISKIFNKLNQLSLKINTPTKKGAKRTDVKLKKNIESMISANAQEGIIGWELSWLHDDAFDLQFWINEDRLEEIKEHQLGRRILITNRHQWSTEEIIAAYWGQANIEYAFKNMKNSFHLAWRPQYHWTDQKIEVHGFICLLAFLLTMLIFKEAREQANLRNSPHTLLQKLSDIRLAAMIETSKEKTKGRHKAVYQLEEMDPETQKLAEAMGITKMSLKTQIPFSVYT